MAVRIRPGLPLTSTINLPSLHVATSVWRSRHANDQRRALKSRAVSVAARLIFAIGLSLSAMTPTAALAELPPRPVPPVIVSTSAAPEVATIRLAFEYSPEWQAITTDWQSLWTVVQWQDGLGEWNDCEGWQGGLDSMIAGVSSKSFWVEQADGGKGPFRWAVLHEEAGSIVAVSDPFDLPSDPSEVHVSSAALSHVR